MPYLICAETNKAIQLTKKIADSGEGTVWKTERTGILAKVYNLATSERADKLSLMVVNKPSDPNDHKNHISFAWPQSLLTDDASQIVGFLMPQVVGGRELIDIYSPRLRKKQGLEVDWRFLHVVSTNIAQIVWSIHNKGYIIGDIKPQNILVNNQALPSIIDTDSFQVIDPQNGRIHHCLVGSQGFTPPELLGEDLSTTRQTTYHDRFRLGVILYFLLFGTHPFGGKWTGAGDSPQQDDLIKNGWWPYAKNSPIQPGPSTISLDIVDSQIKQYFLKCFNDGYDNPALRPSAEDWYYVLRRSVEDLVDCPDVNTHIYRAGYQSCNWCQREATLGVDIFPGKIKPKPSVQVSFSSLEFTAQNLGERITRTITIVNPTPEALLEGKWSVEPHPNDPPHTPDSHTWISFSPKEFQGNQVDCKITVDTSKLKSQSSGSRVIVLKTNAIPESYSLKIQIKTAQPISLEIKKLPYPTMTMLLFVSLFGGYSLVAGLLLLVLLGLVLKGLELGLKQWLELVAGLLLLVLAGLVVMPGLLLLVLVLLVLAGLLGLGQWLAIYLNLPKAERYGSGFILFFHTLAVILGTSIGTALKIGLLANNYVFLAILGSGGLLYFLIVRHLRSKSLIADFKEKDRNLISLS